MAGLATLEAGPILENDTRFGALRRRVLPATVAAFGLSVALLSSGSWASCLRLRAWSRPPCLPTSGAVALVHRGDQLSVDHGARVDRFFCVVLVLVVLRLKVADDVDWKTPRIHENLCHLTFDELFERVVSQLRVRLLEAQ